MNAGIVMLIFIFLIAIAIAIAMAVKSHKMKSSLEEYEFENRSEGGTVEFESFKEAKKHERKTMFARGLANLAGIIIAFVSIIFIVLVI